MLNAHYKMFRFPELSVPFYNATMFVQGSPGPLHVALWELQVGLPVKNMLMLWLLLLLWVINFFDSDPGVSCLVTIHETVAAYLVSLQAG